MFLWQTINITPTNAAIGSCSITGAPHMMNDSKPTEATIPESLARAPDDMLIKLCPIIAHPPIPEKNPVTIFAVP